MSLLIISLAPILIILFYIYFRDRYEKEPIGVLIKNFIAGAIIVIPILFVETGLGNLWEHNIAHKFPPIASAGYNAFVVAAFSEELFKFLAFVIIIWRSKHFNEKFDGIVYAVFISLGFATVENILYVFENGIGTGLLRAFTAVPAHAIFGITMGYYMGLAKMHDNNNKRNLFLAFFMPFLLHGIYDFFLMSEKPILLLLFIPFMIVMFIIGFKNMKKHSDNSIFKQEIIKNEEENFNNFTDNNI